MPTDRLTQEGRSQWSGELREAQRWSQRESDLSKQGNKERAGRREQAGNQTREAESCVHEEPGEEDWVETHREGSATLGTWGTACGARDRTLPGASWSSVWARKQRLPEMAALKLFRDFGTSACLSLCCPCRCSPLMGEEFWGGGRLGLAELH